MTRCPLMLDEDPPCIGRCAVVGSYVEGMGAEAVSAMASQCAASLAGLSELTVEDALATLERMVLLLRGRASAPPDALATMSEFASGTMDAVAGIEHPEMWTLLLRIGDVLFLCGDAARAEQAYSDAVLRNDASPEAWNDVGLMRKRRGDAAGALEAYRRAVELAPDYPQAWFNLAMLHFESGSAEEAKEAFSKASRLDVYNVVAFNNIGVLLRREGKAEEALQHFNRAIAVDKGYAKAWHNKGVALVQMGHEEQGVKCIAHALELDPGLEEARRELSKLGYRPAGEGTSAD